MLKQDENKVYVAGTVIEIDKRTGVKDGVEWISGTVRVETGKDNIIPINFYSSAMTKDKKPNKIYASLKSVCDTYKTVASGDTEPDTVLIETAQLSENIFFPNPDTLIKGFQIQSPFFNRKTVTPDEACAKFSISGTVSSIVEEIKNDLPTGRLIVRLMVVQYGDKGDILELVIEDTKAVEYVKNTYSFMDKMKAQGKIVITEELEIIQEATAFGEPIEQVKRKTTRELIVTSATPPNPSDITNEQMEELLKKRETTTALKKAEAAKKQDTAKSQPQTNGAGGFQL